MPTLNFNLTLSKRTLYTLITFAIIILLGFGVYSFSLEVPNPGHSLSELQRCSEGEMLVSNKNTWQCQENKWENIRDGIKTNDFVGIGEGAGYYDEQVKLSIKGAMQLKVFTSFSEAPPCNSQTRGSIILVTTWDDFPRDKMYACLYNKESYEYIRI